MTITEIAPEALPSDIIAVIAAERADFSVEEVLKKVRECRVYYDVEGIVADGSELEFDILMTSEGPEIVEIQRDLELSELSPDVQTAALKAMGGVPPVRIIESVQTDGAIIYELFAEGQPGDPAHEIRVHAGQIEHLTERWEH